MWSVLFDFCGLSFFICSQWWMCKEDKRVTVLSFHVSDNYTYKAKQLVIEVLNFSICIWKYKK